MNCHLIRFLLKLAILCATSGLLCWWIFVVPEVVLPIHFSGLAELMSADIARNL